VNTIDVATQGATMAEARRELLELLSALCDGELDAGGHARLEALLARDAEARELYLQYVDMHARLLVRPPPGGQALPAGPAAPRRLAPLARYALVSAVTLAASLLVQLAWWPGRPAEARPGPEPRYVATLARTADCVWEGPSQTLRAGARLLPGDVRLRRGVAYIRFDGGPDLVLEGPAELRLESASAATLSSGKVVFRGDESAPPFDLHTPRSTLVDFGTEYAVSVGAGVEEVHVFEGEVRRRPAGGGEEQLKAGEARRYGPGPEEAGRATPLAPARFVRRLAGPREPLEGPGSGLLAYDGFDYADREGFSAGKANGGFGWAGPWVLDFARPLNPGDANRLVLAPRGGLTRPGAAVAPVGGAFEYAGFTKCFRRLAEPVRLDADRAYFLSFLFRRHGPSTSEVNAVALLLWTDEDYQKVGQTRGDPRRQLNVGVRGWNQLFTQLHDASTRTPLPLGYGQTYLLVAKIAASAENPDQVFLRVYGPDEPIEADEPAAWSAGSPPFHSDLVFDWLQLHVNSTARQSIDEVRVGTTWSSVTAPWMTAPPPKKGGRPN
jgi:ferric-dicitrate binding protein FerR (iron transport regulator)